MYANCIFKMYNYISKFKHVWQIYPSVLFKVSHDVECTNAVLVNKCLKKHLLILCIQFPFINFLWLSLYSWALFCIFLHKFCKFCQILRYDLIWVIIFKLTGPLPKGCGVRFSLKKMWWYLYFAFCS